MFQFEVKKKKDLGTIGNKKSVLDFGAIGTYRSVKIHGDRVFNEIKETDVSAIIEQMAMARIGSQRE